MGHYDDAIDAHEELEERRKCEQAAAHFQEILKNRTNIELGRLLLAYESLRRTAKGMTGSRDQHSDIIATETVIDDFHRRR